MTKDLEPLAFTVYILVPYVSGDLVPFRRNLESIFLNYSYQHGA